MSLPRRMDFVLARRSRAPRWYRSSPSMPPVKPIPASPALFWRDKNAWLPLPVCFSGGLAEVVALRNRAYVPPALAGRTVVVRLRAVAFRGRTVENRSW